MKDNVILTVEEIRAALADRNLKKVSEGSGVHYHTVMAVANGTRLNPTYDTYVALANYLAR
jgi:hypothetical protein